MPTIELNTLSPIKNTANFSGVAPVLDLSNGIMVGDIALDTSTGYQWVNLDNTIGAPVWKNILSTAGLIPSGNNQFVSASQLLAVANVSGINTGDQDLSGLVTKTTTVNGHALSGNVTVTKGDVGLGNVSNVNTSTTTNITDSTDKRFVTDAELVVITNTSGVNTGDQNLSGYVPTSRTVNGHALSSNVSVTKTDVGLSNVADVNTTTTLNISDSTNKRFVTDAELVVLGNTSGTNTGDETNATIKSKLGAANASSDGYLTSADWTTFHNSSSGNFVPTYTTVNGHALSSNVAVTAFDVGLGAVANVNTTVTSNITDSTNKRFVTDSELTVLANTSGTNTGDQNLSGYVLKTTTVNGHALTGNVTVTKSDVGLGAVANVDTTTTTNITDSTDKRFVTDADLTVIGNTSNTNTGDQSLDGLVPYTGANAAVVLGAEPLSTTSTVSAYAFLGQMGTVVDSSGTVATDATTGSIFRITVTEAVTLSNPTGAVDGQTITYWISQDGTGGWAITLDTAFDIPAGATITWSTAANKLDMLSVRYNSAISKFHVISFIQGFSAV